MAKKQVELEDVAVEVPEPALVVEDTPLTTDEGLAFAWVEIARALVDLSTPASKKFAVHVAGASFTHVSEDAAGRWVYRIDK